VLSASLLAQLEKGEGASVSLLKIGKRLQKAECRHAESLKTLKSNLKKRRTAPDEVDRQRAAFAAPFVCPVKKDELLAAARDSPAPPASPPSSAESAAATRELSMPLEQYELCLELAKRVSAHEQELDQSKAHVQGLVTTNDQIVMRAQLAEASETAAAAAAEAKLVEVNKDAAASRQAAFSALEKQGAEAAAQAEIRYNLLLADKTSIQRKLNTMTARVTRLVGRLADATRLRDKRKARWKELKEEAEKKHGKQLDRVQKEATSA
jgi:hypothetical protein